MKNVTAKLIAIAKHGCYNRLTKDKEYPVFKISHQRGDTMVTIVTDVGSLETWIATHFIFKTE